MEQGFHISPKSRVRGSQRKIKGKENLIITNASFLGGYKIFVWFSDGKQRVINFEPIFKKFLKGSYGRFLLPANFKKFVVENGNIFWGEDEEVIFPVSFLHTSRHGRNQNEEVLFIL